jgi:3-oxoacyl-[acyl-carrier-protein] synthase II
LAAADEAVESADLTGLGPWALLPLGTSLETFSFERLPDVASLSSLADAGPAAEARRTAALERATTRETLRVPLDQAVRLVEAVHGRGGLALTNSSACAAGLQALGQAFRAVRSGRFELALAGGFDSMLNPLGQGGFQLLGTLATGPSEPGRSPCRPFDVERRGLALGEGAAVMVLEPLERARAEGRRIRGKF